MDLHGILESFSGQLGVLMGTYQTPWNLVQALQAYRPNLFQPCRILKNLFNSEKNLWEPNSTFIEPSRTFSEPFQNLSENFGALQKLTEPQKSLQSHGEMLRAFANCGE